MAALVVPESVLLLATVAVAAAAGAFGLSAQFRDSTARLAMDYGVFVVFGAFAVLGIWLFLNKDQAFFEALLREYWLPALFGVFIIEGAMLLYFAPSEALVPAAIVAAQKTSVAPANTTTYVTIIVTAVVAATIGQYLLFLLAKRWGRERLLERPWFRVSDDQLTKFENWFGKWGLFAVPASNSFLFTRGMLTVPAGLSKMRDRDFIVLSALGTLSFEVLLALAAFGVLELGII